MRSCQDWGRCWAACEDSLGKVGVLVNIAGVRGEEDWEAVYDVNLVTHYGPTYHLTPHPIPRKGCTTGCRLPWLTCPGRREGRGAGYSM